MISLPIPKEISDGHDNDCEQFFRKLVGEFWYGINKTGFDITYTDKDLFLDWIFHSTYGEESGNYGFVRLLTEKELNVIKPYFDKTGINYENEDLRLVVYCYYNCYEPPNYYNLDDYSQCFIK